MEFLSYHGFKNTLHSFLAECNAYGANTFNPDFINNQQHLATELGIGGIMDRRGKKGKPPTALLNAITEHFEEAKLKSQASYQNGKRKKSSSENFDVENSDSSNSDSDSDSDSETENPATLLNIQQQQQIQQLQQPFYQQPQFHEEDQGSYEESLYHSSNAPKNSAIVGGQRIYICPVTVCAKQYQTAAGLRYHSKTVHGKTESGEIVKPSVYPCDTPGCQKVYTTQAGLRYHRKSGVHTNS